MTEEHEDEYAETFNNEYFPYTLGFKKFVEALGYETHYLLAVHDGRIVNALCLSKCGSSGYTPFGFAGGAINSRYVDELYARAKEMFKGRGCNELAIVSSPFHNVQPPTLLVEWRFAQVTHLPSLVYPRTIRKEINKAVRLSFDIEVDSTLDTHRDLIHEFAGLCRKNIERKDSTTHDEKFIDAVLSNLDSELWSCRKDGVLLAAVLLVKSSDVIDYFMVGQVVDEEKRKYALEWLIHNIIESYHDRTWMNWQGSCDSGTKFFKERFRADTFWYPVFKHPLVEQRASFGDLILGLGKGMERVWFGDRA